MPKPGSWNSEYDARLLALLNLGKKRGIDPLNLNKDYIQYFVIEKHFLCRKNKNYSSFAKLYNRKVRSFNLDGTLSGGRLNLSESNY